MAVVRNPANHLLLRIQTAAILLLDQLKARPMRIRDRDPMPETFVPLISIDPKATLTVDETSYVFWAKNFHMQTISAFKVSKQILMY